MAIFMLILEGSVHTAGVLLKSGIPRKTRLPRLGSYVFMKKGSVRNASVNSVRCILIIWLSQMRFYLLI